MLISFLANLVYAAAVQAMRRRDFDTVTAEHRLSLRVHRQGLHEASYKHMFAQSYAVLGQQIVRYL